MQSIGTPAGWRRDVANATDPVTAYRVALKSLGRRHLDQSNEIADLDELINPIVEAPAPALPALIGISASRSPGRRRSPPTTMPTG